VAADSGYPPAEAAARMKLPEGFRVEVFASEPAIRQPVAACFDERGRVWVIEYLQYPTPAGLKPVSVDQYLRTEYDRVPPPPPHGPRGVDRIKILEDTDGDGHADKVTTFVEGLNLASGLAVGHGGVFVGQAPYLLFYPDRDRDDHPDSDPEVLLTGFGLQDAHATVNSMGWGPDGWLYGAQGSTVTANIRGIGFQQGIWRYHPRTKAFELFAEGGGNTWGLDFDRGGNAFGSSNGAFITFHMVQGGYYWKGFAKHGPLHNPRTYGYFDSLEYGGTKHGGHVTPGGIVYKADAYPEEFRGAFIGGNLLANAVYWHKLERKGSTFRARHGGTLVDARDNWFRPIDLLTGPDGSVFVVDWYDKRASHLDPRDNWDKTNGRIYKLVYRDTKPNTTVGDLTNYTSRQLVAFRESGNDWFPDMARRILAERRDRAVVRPLRVLVASDRDEVVALRDLWALYVSGGFGIDDGLRLLDHPLAGVRRWSVRLLGDDRLMSPEIRDRLRDLAAKEPDPTVRSQLASSCQRWRAGDALPILAALRARSEDVSDPQIPLLLWWAYEVHLRNHAEAIADEFCSAEVQKLPLVRDVLLERLARALASDGSETTLAACARLLNAAPGPREAARTLAGIDKGLEGRGAVRVPSALKEAFGKQRDSQSVSLMLDLGLRLGDPQAVEDALALAPDRHYHATDRIKIIERLGQIDDARTQACLLGLFERNDEDPAIRLAALGALGGRSDVALATRLLARYPSCHAALRQRIIDLCTRRATWTSVLLDAIEAGQIPAKDLRPAQVLQVVQLGDSALTRRLEAAWGTIPGPNSEQKRQRIAEVRGILPEGDKGNAARGRPVFKEHCAVCHRLFNEGENIGPDLTGSERGNLEFLLTSLVDPSALIRKEYQAQTVALKDGRVLTGLVVDENDQTLTLVDSNRQKTTVPRAEIEERKPSATSLMPEGQLDKLPDNQIRDLFRYLQSNGS
jgi:putative membrane-bound dehydrogenase-like protein